MLGRVAGADAAHIPYVMGQRGQNGMAPIERRDDPLDASAVQNVLGAKGDECSVLAIVIERVAAADALDDEPGGVAQAFGNVRLMVAIDPAVGVGQLATQRIS